MLDAWIYFGMWIASMVIVLFIICIIASDTIEMHSYHRRRTNAHQRRLNRKNRS